MHEKYQGLQPNPQAESPFMGLIERVLVPMVSGSACDFLTGSGGMPRLLSPIFALRPDGWAENKLIHRQFLLGFGQALKASLPSILPRRSRGQDENWAKNVKKFYLAKLG
jgi:hypothetical protein